MTSIGNSINFFPPATTYELEFGDCELSITPSNLDQLSSVSTQDILNAIDGILNQCLVLGQTAEGYGPGGQDPVVPDTPAEVTFSVLLFQQPVSVSTEQAISKGPGQAGTRRARRILH